MSALLPFAMDSTASYVPAGATVFDVRSRWPVVDGTYYAAARNDQLMEDWSMGELPFSLSLLRHCKLAAEYKQLPPKTYVPTSVHVRLRGKG